MIEVTIKDGVAFRVITSPEEWECSLIEICCAGKEGNIKLIHFYNSCKKLTIEIGGKFKKRGNLVW